MSRLTFISLLSGLVIVLALVLQFRPKPLPSQIAPQAIEKTEPTYYLTGIQTKEFTPQGDLRYRLDAKQVSYYLDQDYTLASNPDIMLFHSDGTPWRVRAEQGRVGEKYEVVDLWDNVDLQRLTPKDPLQMETSALTVLPKRNAAHTDRDVVITGRSTRATGTGMKAMIDQNRMELLANVRVQHDPIDADRP